MSTQASLDRKINMAVRRGVVEAIRELLSDPDRGLALTESAKRRLRSSIRAKERGRVTPLCDVLTKYGL